MSTPINTRDAILQASIRFENDEVDNAIALLRGETNRLFAQRAEPFTSTSYSLRINDAWIDSGSINYATYTSEMSSGTNEYSLVNMSATLLNQVVGPLPYITGTSLVADRFIEDTTPAVGRFISKPIKWANIGTGTHTISIYLKEYSSSPKRFAELIVTSTPAGVNKYASFDLSTGTSKTSDDSTITAYCSSVGNGWYRCSITVTIVAAITASLQIRLSDINTSFAHAYTGNGTSGVYAWGLMVEANVSGNVAPGKYIDNSTGVVPGVTNTVNNHIIYTWDGLYWSSAQLKELDDISSDNVLTPVEKTQVIKERDSILTEQTELNNQASAFGNLTTATTTYNSAVTTLTNYLATLVSPYLWDDLTAGHITNIVGTTFRNTFNTFYTARNIYRNNITARAAELAAWEGVSGTGKPADNATNGTLLNTDPFCTNLTKWSGTGIGYYTSNTITNGQVGTTSFRHSANANRYIKSNLIPVDPNKVYRVRGWFRKSSGADGTFYLIAGLADSNGTIIAGTGSHWRYPARNVSPSTTWTEYSGIFGYGQIDAIPSNAKYVYIGTYLHFEGTTGYHEVQGLRLEDITESRWQNITGTNRPEDSANNIGVSSETPPSGAIALTSTLDTSTGTYLLRPIKSKNKGLDISLTSDSKTIELESHSSERDHILLSSDFSMSSASLSNVPGMEFTADSNTKYYMNGIILVSSTLANTGFLLGISGPAGTTINMVTTSGSIPLANTVFTYTMEAIISVAGTAGLIKLRFASEDTNTVTLKQNSLLVLNEVVNVTPPISGGYVINTTEALGTSYTSSQDTTSGGATASVNLNVKTNGSITITVGTGDSLYGTPTSDNWSTGSGNDSQNFEVLFTVGSTSGSPTISNGAASYTRLDANRTISVTRSCSYGFAASASASVTVTVRKRGTTTPVYSDTTTLIVNVSSENPYV